MPILVKSDDVRSGRKAKGRHGPLWRLGSQWVNINNYNMDLRQPTQTLRHTHEHTQTHTHTYPPVYILNK